MISRNHLMNINKYITVINNNPYLSELKTDIKSYMEEQTLHLYKTTILENLEVSYKQWLENIPYIQKDKIISVCNNKEDIILIASYIMKNVEVYNNEQFNIFIKNLSYNWKTEDAVEDFNPSELKYVTSTAICYIRIEDATNYEYNIDNAILVKNDNTFEIQFKKLYDDFIAPPVNSYDVLNSEYHPDYINKIVGCINNNGNIKGICHNKHKANDTNTRHFQNSASVIVSIDKSKEVNVKLFINGKLQLTGVPMEEDGIRTVKILADYIYEKYSIKMSIYDYSTVMINTCYDLGFHINREVLYDIFINRYNLIAVFDTEGYPGVRVHYFYNDATKLTTKEGQCVCPELCEGGGDGNGFGKCKRISVAIFQSGKVIIAGGCRTVEPIENAYRFINCIMKNIKNEIKKEMINNTVNKVNRKRRHMKLTKIKLDRKLITNIDLYRDICLLCSSFK
jgi:TATA-box binding protein (TBP) (component of TFIID and TFIIIB)